MHGRKHIETFEQWFHGVSHDVVAIAHPSYTGDRTPPSGDVVFQPQASSRVNHGRWIADCPFCDIGAELVNFDTGLFFCCNCRNAQVEHAFIRVVIPRDAERKRIEDVLLERPVEETRNWQPEETVADLVRENAAQLN